MLDELSSCVYPSMLCFCLSYYTARQFVGLVDLARTRSCSHRRRGDAARGPPLRGRRAAKHIDEHGAPVAPAPAPRPGVELPDAQLDKERRVRGARL